MAACGHRGRHAQTCGGPTGRPILGGGRPIFWTWPPEFGLRAAPFGGVAALVAAGRPADQIGAQRPVTGPRFLSRGWLCG
eukprot:scaffold13480_cov27-Phaeocystis_antarctica.AAC.1